MKSKRAIVFGAVLLAGACASNPARSALTVPLETPEPPPRVAMDPVPAVVVGTPVAPERPVAAPVTRPAGLPPPVSTAAATPPATPPAPQTPAVVPTEPPRTTPPPELRAAGTGGRTPTAAQVRDRLVRTRQKLDAIDRRKLNAGQLADYDSARRFLAQTEAAVKENNLLLAESSVEKAETLADGLR
jgi:hypothetical protein